MNKSVQKVIKFFLYVATNSAFLLLLSNVNTTCCGPGYQPALPAEIDDLRIKKMA